MLEVIDSKIRHEREEIDLYQKNNFWYINQTILKKGRCPAKKLLAGGLQ